jgi:hypothetical protein
MSAIGDFGELTADKARALAGRYDLDYAVTENQMALPEVYRNGSFVVYDLRSRATEVTEGAEVTTEQRSNGERTEDSARNPQERSDRFFQPGA